MNVTLLCPFYLLFNYLFISTSFCKFILCKRPVRCQWEDINVALAVGLANKWLTLELGITQLCWATCSQPQHTSPYLSLLLSSSFSVFSWSACCLWQTLQQVFETESTICYQLCLEPLLTTTHSHSSSYNTVTEQLLVLHRHNRQELRETRAWIEEKRETTLGISISSSKALSWKRTEGLRG